MPPKSPFTRADKVAPGVGGSGLFPDSAGWWKDLLACPSCRIVLDRAANGGASCPGCGKRAVLTPDFRGIDFSAFLSKTATGMTGKVNWAYSLYSIAYAPLALLNMLTVWRGSLGRLVGHYRNALSSAPFPILDLAIGDGSLTRLALRRIAPPVALLGLDISRPMLVKAEGNLRGDGFPKGSPAGAAGEGFRSILADARALPVPDRTFNRVCCYGGLHVIPDPELVLAEAFRVLLPGGTFHASILLRPGGHFPKILARRYVELGFLSNDFTEKGILELVGRIGFRNLAPLRNGYMLLLDARKPGE